MRDVLDSAKERGFRLTRALPKWHRRGYVIDGLPESDARCLIRADPVEDDMEGFFVAIFERRRGDDAKQGIKFASGESERGACGRDKKGEKETSDDRRRERAAGVRRVLEEKSNGGKPTPLFR